MVAITPLPIDEVLPEDVIIEILTNLHPDDLSVCLEINHKFNQLVNDPYVKSRQSKTLCGYLIHNGHNYSFLPDQLAMKCSEVGPSRFEVFDNLEILKQRYTTVEAVSQCRGLVCCVLGGYLNRRYYVCKPATGQCRAIPNPKLRFETAATAIVASLSGQEFKIVRFSLPRSGRSLYLRCEVFDSRAWRWHRCNDINQDIRFPGDWRRDGAVFAHGSMHWFTQQGIFAFNMHRETWKLIALPVEFKDFENKHHTKITLRDAKLSLVCINHDEQVVVRRMDRYFEEEWGPQQVVCFSNAQIQDDSWLRIFIDLIYSSSFGPNSLSNYKWEGVWKDRLNAKDANKSFLGGDVFRFQSDSTPCKALQQAT